MVINASLGKILFNYYNFESFTALYILINMKVLAVVLVCCSILIPKGFPHLTWQKYQSYGYQSEGHNCAI